MSKTINFAVIAALVVTVGILLPGTVWAAVGQDQSQSECVEGQNANQPANSGMTQDDMKDGMGTIKISEPMKMRCGMMMKMEVTSHDPPALLALKDQLKLTKEQTTSLKAIVAEARQQAEKVLTDQQKTQLQPLDKLPTTMMGMHQNMMKKMGRVKNGMKRQMMCPMMEQMSYEQPVTKNTDNK